MHIQQEPVDSSVLSKQSVGMAIPADAAA